VRAGLARLVEAAKGSENTIPAMLDAIRAEATLGEVCGALRDLWGSYTEPPRF
jgi:methylmalonyl-CoA mutase N-terminal domain/subunit